MSWTAQPYRPVHWSNLETSPLIFMGNHPTKWCSIVTSDTGGILLMLTGDVPIEDIEDGHFHGFFYCF